MYSGFFKISHLLQRNKDKIAKIYIFHCNTVMTSIMTFVSNKLCLDMTQASIIHRIFSVTTHFVVALA